MSQLYPLQVTAPGFYGLNTQQSVTGDLHWASTAENCVVDDRGRIACRKGRLTLTATPISGTPSIRAIYEQVLSVGTITILSAAGNKLYSGTGTLTEVTGTAGSGTGVTSDHWQMQNIADRVVAFQDAHDPIVRTTGNFSLLQQSITAWATGTAYVVGDVRRATAGNLTLYFHCTTSGTSHATTEPTWNTSVGGTTTDNTVTWTTRKMPNGNVCHSAFGRIWTTSNGDDSVIEFSDTLLPHIFRGGAAGTLDLKTVWGGDQVVAISSIEDYLVIFGKKNIIIYGGPEVPSTMALSEKIEGTGCIARDSVQSTGNDLVFLSNNGVRLLSRAIEAGGRQPLGDLSVNVRDTMMNQVSSETTALIKSTFHEPEGFYVLSLTGVGTDWVFDLRFPNPDGSAKITTWLSFGGKSFYSSRDRTLYIGGAGVVAKYSSYNDGAISTYIMRYKSTWMDFSSIDPVIGSRFKIPKSWRIRVISNVAYLVTYLWAFDFNETFSNSASQLAVESDASEWNVAEWNIGEWSGGVAFSDARIHSSGHGQVMKIGTNVTINGSIIAFQEILLGAKLGRTAF